MRAATVQISDQFIAKRTSDLVPTKQAWADYVRRRWPENCVAHVQREWSLSEGEARGVVFSSISQRVIDQIRAHKRGGLTVVLAVEATAWGTTTRQLISAWVEIERGRIADERARGDDDDRRMVEIAKRLGGDAGGDVG